jgi:hypothetical protein
MKKYGSKDIMRMDSIREKARGDYMQQIMYGYNMACAITEPGKAMARGFAAQEVFGDQSAMGQVFFERAFDLSDGKVVRPVASVNPLDDSEEGIEAEYDNIPMDEQPASRRPHYITYRGRSSHQTSIAALASYGKINTIKGTGPGINLYDNPSGTIEVWQTDGGKYRLVYTSHYDPIYGIDAIKQFKHEGKVEEWKCVDYIDTKYISNLAPLYGKSILIFCYD